MKQKTKQLTSIGIVALMLMSLVAFASAMAYPSPFVENGNTDVAVVYGSKAAASDVLAVADFLAVADLIASLQAELAAQTYNPSTSQQEPVISGGEFIKLERPSDKFNLGDSTTDVFVTSITKNQLPTLLEDGVYYDDDNTQYRYIQKIELETFTLEHFRDRDYSSTPTIGFNLPSNTLVLSYTLDFTKEPTFSNEKMSNTDIVILGKDYFILNIDPSGEEMTLLDTAETVFMNEGEERTITVDGKEYVVFVSFIGSDKVKLVVDGEITKSLSEGATYKLKDGSYIGIKDILASSSSSRPSKVEFSIGSGKLFLSNEREIRINDKDVDELTSYLIMNSDKLDRIVIEWRTDDKEFITTEKELEMPALQSVKFSMAGLNFPLQENIVLENDGSTSILLKIPIESGEARFNILYADSTGQFIGLGKDEEKRLVTSDSNTLTFNETNGDKWFVASWASSRDSESYLLSAKVTSKDGGDRVTIKNEVTGANVCTDFREGSTCSIGNFVLTINEVYREGSDKWATFTISNGGSFNTLYSKEGLKLYLPYILENSTEYGAVDFETGEVGHNSESFYLYFIEEDKDSRVASGETFYFTVTKNSNGGLHISDVSLTSERRIGDSSRYEYYVVSDLATKILHDRTSNQYKATLTYYGDQVYANVYLTEVKAEVISSEPKSPVKDIGSVYISDSEVNSVGSKNLIVVGGSCVNSYAAELVGGNFCGDNWEEKTGVGAGEFLIQTFSLSNGKIAVLVAGYEAEDTINAVKALKTKSNNIDLNSGKKYIGTSSTNVNLI